MNAPQDIEQRSAEPATASEDDRLKVFYDGSCPLCRKEIAFLGRRTGSEALDFQDISGNSHGEIAPGLSCEAAMERMYVQTPDGQLKSGAAAFLELWGRLPALKPFVAILRVPPIPWILERAYRGFLVIRPSLQRWAGKTG
jgi:predicted DCC family thiol-disulfide oxidoreductase YuxK